MKIKRIIHKNRMLFIISAIIFISLSPIIIGKICEPLINAITSVETIHCHDIAEYGMFGLSIEILIICIVFLIKLVTKSIAFFISYEKAVIKYANWDFEHETDDETTAAHYINRLKQALTYKGFGRKFMLTIKPDEFILMVSTLVNAFGINAINTDEIISVLNLISDNSIRADRNFDISRIVYANTINKKPSIIANAKNWFTHDDELVLIQPDKSYASKDFDRYTAVTEQNVTEIAESIIKNNILTGPIRNNDDALRSLRAK